MRSYNRSTLVAGAVATALLSSASYASKCPNAGGISQIITKIPWSETLPIIAFGGAKIGSGANREAPPDRNKSTTCACENDAGEFLPGTSFGMYQPSFYVEVTDAPYCFASIEGLDLDKHGSMSTGDLGNKAADPSSFEANMKKYHVHIVAMPLLVMLDFLVDNSCNPGGFMDMDPVFMSETNPCFLDPELSPFCTPQVALYANPFAVMAGQMTEALVTPATPLSVISELDKMQWVGFGPIYPQNSFNLGSPSVEMAQSNLTVRALDAATKLGILKRSVGSDAMCGGKYSMMIKKSQYRISQYYPRTEANGSHYIGENSFYWGEWRNNPNPSYNTFVNTMFRWVDCCIQFAE